MAAEIPNGYVFLARDVLKSTLWQRRPEDRIVALTSIVLANHQSAVWHDGNRDVHFSRGQFAQSWGHLAERANLSVKNVRTSIERLGTGPAPFMTRKPNTYYSVFSIPNYSKYQDRDRYGREKEMPEGAILVARKILESSLWKMSAQDRVVGITCLLIANHTPGSMDVNGEAQHLERGQFFASWDRLAKACRLTVEQTQESVARLITSEFLVRDRLSPAVFTIPNYNRYQDPQKYSDSGARAGVAATQGVLFELPVPSEPSEPARTRQGGGKEVARTRQGGGKEAATDKNSKNDKNGEEGGRTPPAPELFEADSRGAPPPLPPGVAEIADAYIARFPKVMGREKALYQAKLYLSRGGKIPEALQALREENREGVVIWKILDPLLEKTGDWRETFVAPKEWQSEEPAERGTAGEGN